MPDHIIRGGNPFAVDENQRMLAFHAEDIDRLASAQPDIDQCDTGLAAQNFVERWNQLHVELFARNDRPETGTSATSCSVPVAVTVTVDSSVGASPANPQEA